MDLGAYAQIDDLKKIMEENNISVPRLRGLRLMKYENPIEDIDKVIKDQWLWMCENSCCSDFIYNPSWSEYSQRTEKIRKRYMIYDKDHNLIDVNWKAIHGKKRKLFKYNLKLSKRQVIPALTTYNKYCGQDNVLYIHARIGGLNWVPYGGPELAKQPWFIKKVDDYFDNTYCDIYARIKQR